MADGDVAKVPLIPRVPGEATQDLDTPELADLAVLPNCARGALMSVGYVLKFEIEWWYVASGMWQVVCGEDGSHSELTVHQALD